MSDRFENVGEVVKLYSNGYVDLLVHQLSACSSCHASCSMAGDNSEKIFHLKADLTLNVGEKVRVIIDNTTVKRSAFLAYMLPVLLVVVIALILQSLNLSDISIAFSSLATLLIYFVVLKLYLRRSDSNIKIEKIDV
ncbi:MAG: SoxR reducing system RseC family protein [Calditerrivibrio sp.]|nr:SoxR reducing system RseC family protein [Calditerrivibrio sp.]